MGEVGVMQAEAEISGLTVRASAPGSKVTKMATKVGGVWRVDFIKAGLF